VLLEVLHNFLNKLHYSHIEKSRKYLVKSIKNEPGCFSSPYGLVIVYKLIIYKVYQVNLKFYFKFTWIIIYLQDDQTVTL
jgi:hypothetical protein